MTKKSIEYELSSGNVYADLGLADAGELQARGEIGMRVVRLLQERDLNETMPSPAMRC
jgi:predicted XRE-type DNA-binding protein